MQTILFLSQRGYHLYNFAKIYHADKYRFVAILTESNYAVFPDENKQFFSKIYTIKDATGGDFIEKFSLDFQQLRTIIKKEITAAGGPNQIRIICIDEFNLLNAGKLRDEFNIKGAGYELTQLYRDKTIMKQKLHDKGIRVPKFIDFDQQLAIDNPQAYYQILTDTINAPFIVKPVAGAGSTITEKVSNSTNFAKLCRIIYDASVAFEAEEFIEGKLYHCDSLVQNDKVIFTTCSEYLYPNMEFLKGKPLVSIVVHDEDPIKKRLTGFTSDVLYALGPTDGVTHMEMFVTAKDEIVFLEVATRPPGSDVIPNYEITFGINLVDLSLQIQMGEHVTIEKKRPQRYSFVTQLPRCKGKILRLNEPKLKSQYKIQWKVKPGDMIDAPPKTLLDIVATFHASNTNYEILHEDFESLRHYQPMVMET